MAIANKQRLQQQEQQQQHGWSKTVDDISTEWFFLSFFLSFVLSFFLPSSGFYQFGSCVVVSIRRSAKGSSLPKSSVPSKRWCRLNGMKEKGEGPGSAPSWRIDRYNFIFVATMKMSQQPNVSKVSANFFLNLRTAWRLAFYHQREKEKSLHTKSKKFGKKKKLSLKYLPRCLCWCQCCSSNGREPCPGGRRVLSVGNRPWRPTGK